MSGRGPAGIPVVAGKFRLAERMHAGEDIEVYRAVHMGISREVVLKILRQDADVAGEAAQRLLREARAAGSVAHRNVQSVVDSGLDERGLPYAVFEHLAGSTLAEILSRSPDGLQQERAERIMLQVLEGMRAVHQGGVIHRNVTPHAIVIVPVRGGGEFAKITAFDDAAFVEDGSGTAPVRAMPSVYSAPEVRAGGRVDQRADVYSAGLLLRAVLSGGVDARRVVGEAHKRIIDRAVATDPDRRFGDADSMFAALLQVRGPESSLHAAARSLSSGAIKRPSPGPDLPSLTPPSPGGRPTVQEPKVELLAVLLAIEAMLRFSGKAAWQRVVAEVPEADRLLPGAGDTTANRQRGVPRGLFERILVTGDRLFGQGDLALVKDIGMVMSRRGLHRIVSELEENPSIENVAAVLPRLWRATGSLTSAAIEAPAPGVVLVSADDRGHPSRTVCALRAGVLRGALEIAGAQVVTVDEPECQGDGRPLCVFEGRWLERATPPREG